MPGLVRIAAVIVALGLPSTASDRRSERVRAMPATDPPPVAVPFRWSATATCSTQGEVRGAANRCRVGQDGEVAVAPDAAGLVVTRGGAQTWSTALPGAARSPVVAVVDDAVVVAGLVDDAIALTILDLTTGAVRGRAQAPAAGVTAVQLERRHDGEPVRVHARTGAGGITALLDPITGMVLGLANTPTAAIVDRMEPGSSADGVVTMTDASGSIVAGWDDGDLRVAADGWRVVLSRSAGPMRNEQVTAHATGDLIVGTIHHPSSSWTQAFALARGDGAIRWRRTVTGLGPTAHSGYQNRVSSRIAGDALIVQGVESAGAYVCTLDLATGRERACVDGLAAADVVAPVEPTQLPGPRPVEPRPLGPRTTSVRCRPTAAGPTLLSARRSSAVDLTGMITVGSASCAVTLSGGIVGDRIELHLADQGPPAAEPCTCQVHFRQDYRPETVTLIVQRDGAELTRLAMPAW